MSGGCDSGGTQDTDRNLSVVRTVDMYFLSQRHNDTTEIPCERDDDFVVKLEFKNPERAGAPNGSVPQNICSSCKFLLAGRCGTNNSPWKESVAGKKIIQGVRGDLKSRIAATGYLYGLLTTQDLNCAL